MLTLVSGNSPVQAQANNDATAFSRRLDNAARAAKWLASEHGLSVIELRITRKASVLRVASVPRLWRIFSGECAWREREQRGALTVFTWFATIFGTRIEWEEVQCR